VLVAFVHLLLRRVVWLTADYSNELLNAEVVLSLASGGGSVQLQLGPGDESPAIDVTLNTHLCEGRRSDGSHDRGRGRVLTYHSSLRPGSSRCRRSKPTAACRSSRGPSWCGSSRTMRIWSSATQAHRAREDRPTSVTQWPGGRRRTHTSPLSRAMDGPRHRSMKRWVRSPSVCFPFTHVYSRYVSAVWIQKRS